ncbi:hypothetical protein [Neobacillus cucumis]|uniref:helix-turn-helix transcriptional regulator n=1 Tax=Neobacillus cucumis TaxID=1740721 RepID=UPI002E1F40CF|nr:hypothetical protein [Neobacillus cucumis]
MVEFISVKQVAERYGRSQEQVKRWLRKGEKFPNAIKTSDKKGWQIPLTDIQNDLYGEMVQEHGSVPLPIILESGNELKELIILAFQVGTLKTPTEDIINLGCSKGLKQMLEAMLVVRQNEKNIRNFNSFVHDAIFQGWSSSSTPKKVENKKENIHRKQAIRKPIRTEIVPEWFDEPEVHKKQSVDSLKDLEQKKREIQEMLVSLDCQIPDREK